KRGKMWWHVLRIIVLAVAEHRDCLFAVCNEDTSGHLRARFPAGRIGLPDDDNIHQRLVRRQLILVLDSGPLRIAIVVIYIGLSKLMIGVTPFCRGSVLDSKSAFYDHREYVISLIVLARHNL